MEIKRMKGGWVKYDNRLRQERRRSLEFWQKFGKSYQETMANEMYGLFISNWQTKGSALCGKRHAGTWNRSCTSLQRRLSGDADVCVFRTEEWSELTIETTSAGEGRSRTAIKHSRESERRRERRPQTEDGPKTWCCGLGGLESWWCRSG